MKFIPIPTQPFNHLVLDVQGPFIRSSRGHSYIITGSCITTRFLETEPVASATTEAVINFLVTHIYCRHGTPKIISTDLGTVFTATFFKDLAKALGVHHITSTAAHPQSQGVTERVHGVLTDAISIYLTDRLSNQRDWDRFVPAITFAINTSVNRTTNFSPSFLIYGRELVFPIQAAVLENENEPMASYLHRLRTARVVAFQNVHRAQQDYAKYYNMKRRDHAFKVGDVVLVKKALQRPGLSRKLFSHFYGPYSIISVDDVNCTVKLNDVNQGEKIETVHVEKLKYYYPRFALSTQSSQNNALPNLESQQENVNVELEPRNNVDAGAKIPTIVIQPPLNEPTQPVVLQQDPGNSNNQNTNVELELSNSLTRRATSSVPFSVLEENAPRYNLRTRKQIHYPK